MKLKLVMGAMLGPMVLSGCATTPCAVESTTPGLEKVSVRFTTPAETAHFAALFNTQSNVRLASHGAVNVVQDGRIVNDVNNGPAAFRAVMWGGNLNGADVTYESTPLSAGQYMFGMFDEYNGKAYQGWLNVNNGSDDYLDLLREWRNTVHQQKAWLGYDRKLDGQFASDNPTFFKDYAKQVRAITRLENRINDAIEAEKRDRLDKMQQQASVFGNAEVLLTPSVIDFDHPSTRPAISTEELDRVGDGYPLTKIVTVADYAKSVEKLHRVNDLRRELQRNRSVFEEEVKRLQRRKRYYTITDHLYKHDKAFVQNERRLQDAIGVVDKIDHQLEDHRNRAYALAFVAGLFAPEVTAEVFDQEEQDLRHDRVVLEERLHQLDQRFDRLDPDSSRRVSVESDRQTIAAAIENLDKELGRVDSARLAINTLRDSSGVIHRQGTASVYTASIFDGSVPAFVADAIERESLMTIRLQASEATLLARSYTGGEMESASVSARPHSPVTGPAFKRPPANRTHSNVRQVSQPSPKPTQHSARNASVGEPAFAKRVEPVGGDFNEGVLWDDCCVDTFASKNSANRSTLASNVTKPSSADTVTTVYAPAPKPVRTNQNSSILVGQYPSAQRVVPVGGDYNEGVLWDDCCVDKFASKNNPKRSTLASNVSQPSSPKTVTKAYAPASKPIRTTKNSSILVGEYPSAQRVVPVGGDFNEGVLWDDCCVDEFAAGPVVKRKTLASKVTTTNSGKTDKKAATPAWQPTESKVIYIPAHPEMLEKAPR